MPKGKYQILIIEDEPDISQIIKFGLIKNGFSVSIANNGEKGLNKARNDNPDLILLDLMLPGIHGLEVCKILKTDQSTKNINIIILTALGQEEDIIKGLENGADDYITKPFNIKILNARVRAVLRRVGKKTDKLKSILIHNIKITPKKREVTINNVLIELTFTEFQILHLLATHPGWVFTRYQIIEKIRGDNYPVTDRSVDFQIVGLRKKMKEKGKVIETIRGVGYRFQPDEK